MSKSKRTKFFGLSWSYVKKHSKSCKRGRQKPDQEEDSVKQKEKGIHFYGHFHSSPERILPFFIKLLEKILVHHRDRNPTMEEDLNEYEANACQKGEEWCNFPHL